MARQAQIREQDPNFDFKEIKQRFFALNKARLQRTRADLRQRQLDFLELLPLLYHINHPTLPGYVSKHTPAGIPDYSPGNLALQLASRLSKSFSYKRRAYRRFHVQALYMMGSTGTIAYSSKSDFDIWVCYDSQLNQEQVEALTRKSAAIEEWARTLEVDVHIFLVNPEEFRLGKHGALSSESSGSALHYLLLEEFYRTSLLLAGLYPIWWLVPPEHEAQYDEFVDDIKRKRYVHSRDNIDFGGLDKIPADEFYGATLWLLYKGIHSPYKSVLKTLLMEAYASEYPNIDILGLRFKRAVYSGENEINKLDPYLMMLHKAEEYLGKRNQPERLELIRTSFYFKVNQKLSEDNGKEDSWRRKLLAELIAAWGWTASKLFMLDSKDNWKIQRVIEERNSVIRELTNSYRFLSEFARNHSDTNLINARDLNLLGRKLYAAFERKAGKVEIIYRGITHDLYETHLSIHRLRGEDNREFWLAFSGVINETDAATATPLRRAYNLVELLAWCYFNKVVTSNSMIAIYHYGYDLSDKEVKLIIAMLEKTFQDDDFDEDNMEALRRPSRVKKVLTIVNAGIDPFMQHTRRGEHLTSNRTDSLRYGGRLENLAHSVDQIVMSSWNEVLTYRHTGIEGLFQAIQEYMRWSPPSNGVQPPTINAVSYSCYRGNAIAHRVEALFQDIMDCFYNRNHSPATRYVMAVEWDYYLLYLQDDILQYQKAGNLQALSQVLAKPSREFRQVVFDSQTLSDDVLPTLYAHNRAGVVQVFFQIQNDKVQTYILDEQGSLFTHESKFYDAISMVNQYERFFQSIHKRMQYLRSEGRGHTEQTPRLEFYYVEKGKDNTWQLVQHRSSSLFKSKDYIKLQVLGDRIANEVIFTVYCNDREYTTVEHGESLYQHVANYILQHRQEDKEYPIYITDIDLSKSLLGAEYASVQTVHYLQYKRHFESKLQQFLDIL
jgi:adenylate cyclase class 1